MTRLMSVSALILTATSLGVSAQSWPTHEPSDEWTLDVLGPAHATVSYYNSDPPNSGYFPRELVNGDLIVGIEVVTSAGPETLIVSPPPGWVAIPPTLDVIDGEMGVVDLIRGEFLGM
jgi:hypothetical protein